MALVNNNLSSVVDFQFPEVIRNENPDFVRFIKSYYQFLESIQLCVKDSTGDFIEGTDVRGANSKAVGKILSIDTSEELGEGIYLYVHQTKSIIFQEGEIVSSDSASGNLSHFKRNPLNASKSLIDWTDPHTVNNEYFGSNRGEFFENYPEWLKVDKELFLTKIRELYLEKGNERSYKTLFNMAFGPVRGRLQENLEFYYPKVDILKPSSGEWIIQTTLQISPDLSNYDFIAKEIVGEESLASAFVTEVSLKKVASTQVLELYLKNTIGKFLLGEKIEATSAESDGHFANTNLLGMLTTDPNKESIKILDGGNGYLDEEDCPLVNATGVGAKMTINETSQDQVVKIQIDNPGNGYQVDDAVDFDNHSTIPVSSARAKVKTLKPTTLFTKSINNERLCDVCQTHVLFLETNTDIPIREGFLISNYSVYEDALSTKKGIVIDVYSNTNFRYTSTEGSLFTNGDTLYAYNDQGQAYYPHLVSEVSGPSIPYTNDITLDSPDFSQTSANTNFEGSFTQNRESILTESNDSIISESGDHIISEKFRDPININSTLDNFSFYDKTFGEISEIEILSFGKNYTGIPTASIKTNSNLKELNDHSENFTMGTNGSLSIPILGGAIKSIRIDNPGAAFSNTAPGFDFSNTGDGLANATITLDSTRYYDGYYKGSDGQLSSHKKIQDSNYYQDFSYVLWADQDVNNYRDLVLNTIHPAGTRMFGEVVVRSLLDLRLFEQNKRDINWGAVQNNAVYRWLGIIYEQMINLQIPEYTITGAKNWETYFEINTEDIVYIDGVPLKNGTISTVATNTFENDLKVENHLPHDVRFWSTIQSYNLELIDVKYEKYHYDLEPMDINVNSTSITLTLDYYPGSLLVYRNGNLIPKNEVDQSSGTTFTIPLSSDDKQNGSDAINSQIEVTQSYIKIKVKPHDHIDGGKSLILDDVFGPLDGGHPSLTRWTHNIPNPYNISSYEETMDGGNAGPPEDPGFYLNEDDVVYVQCDGELNDVIREQKFLIKNIDGDKREAILYQLSDWPLKNYLNAGQVDNQVDFKLFKPSKDLWSTSIIKMLENERVGYYRKNTIDEYYFEQNSDMRNVFSADDNIFLDKTYLSINEDILMEDGNTIGIEQLNTNMSLEGVVAKGPNDIDWRLPINEYQYHTVESVDPYRIVLGQHVSHRLNSGYLGSSYHVPAYYTLQSQTIMKRI
tara:strand:- start:215 stop:3793 length:3579 start_codon:yes stop_codon:yes gene_type:complete